VNAQYIANAFVMDNASAVLGTHSHFKTKQQLIQKAVYITEDGKLVMNGSYLIVFP
jgi:calcineurin-like phosphoesterase